MANEPVIFASHSAIVLRRPSSAGSTLCDYWAVTKPEVNFLILITTAAGFYLSWPGKLSSVVWILLLNTLLGTLLVASGAATLNQWMEHPFDARMRRTGRRPIAAGRIEAHHAWAFGAGLSMSGVAYLAFEVGILASLLAAFTLGTYLFLYTPLKRRTPWCTAIGAVAGAIPPLIGAGAARGRLDFGAWVLFAIVLLWQFPHFMAIAWMYRDDYDRAGYKILPGAEARRRFVAWHTRLPLVALLAVSVSPVLHNAAAGYGVVAAAASGWFLHVGRQFLLRQSAAAARYLLIVSIAYLPALLVLLVLFAT